MSAIVFNEVIADIWRLQWASRKSQFVASFSNDALAVARPSIIVLLLDQLKVPSPASAFMSHVHCQLVDQSDHSESLFGRRSSVHSELSFLLRAAPNSQFRKKVIVHRLSNHRERLFFRLPSLFCSHKELGSSAEP